jgi:hypothetical protein
MKTDSSSNKSPSTKNMKIVVIGGSGLIGTKLVNNLRRQGYEVVAASPSSGVNTLTGEGLASATPHLSCPCRRDRVLRLQRNKIVPLADTRPHLTQPIPKFPQGNCRVENWLSAGTLWADQAKREKRGNTITCFSSLRDRVSFLANISSQLTD